jgi:hypothetical protein
LLTETSVKIEGKDERELNYSDLIGFTCDQLSHQEYKLVLNCFCRVKRLLRAVRREISQISLILLVTPAQVEQVKA